MGICYSNSSGSVSEFGCSVVVEIKAIDNQPSSLNQDLQQLAKPPFGKEHRLH